MSFEITTSSIRWLNFWEAAEYDATYQTQDFKYNKVSWEVWYNNVWQSRFDKDGISTPKRGIMSMTLTGEMSPSDLCMIKEKQKK